MAFVSDQLQHRAKQHDCCNVRNLNELFARDSNEYRNDPLLAACQDTGRGPDSLQPDVIARFEGKAQCPTIEK